MARWLYYKEVTSVEIYATFNLADFRRYYYPSQVMLHFLLKHTSKKIQVKIVYNVLRIHFISSVTEAHEIILVSSKRFAVCYLVKIISCIKAKNITYRYVSR